LFSDIVGSSGLYARLGNDKAEEKIGFVIRTMTGCAERFSGRVIKTIGDELMCLFNDISDATDAATEMNRLVQESAIELRTGISSGDIIERDGDVFGNTVNNAAFLTKVARAREIVVDHISVNRAIDPSVTFDLIGEITIKGQKDKTRIYRVNWENHLSMSMGATAIAHTGRSAALKLQPSLLIDLGAEQYDVPGNGSRFIIGRDRQHVTLHVSATRISRKHCSIYFQQGKFILEDHSTNGTFVSQGNVTETYVHRESLPLMSAGQFSLGQPLKDSDSVFHFKFQ